jgi:hypothetical protein
MIGTVEGLMGPTSMFFLGGRIPCCGQSKHASASKLAKAPKVAQGSQGKRKQEKTKRKDELDFYLFLWVSTPECTEDRPSLFLILARAFFGMIESRKRRILHV